jgi:hypothetical protein
MTPWRRASSAPKQRSRTRRRTCGARRRSARSSGWTSRRKSPARAKTARRECGTDLNDATEKKARASKHASRVLGATRRHPPFSKHSNPTPKEKEKETIPRFARPAWESRDEDAAASPSGDEKKTAAAAAAEENKNPRDESRESLGGFDEKGLASVLAAATQLAPGRRVSPATADAADFVRVLRYAQRQHSLNLGVPAFAKGANHFESPTRSV